MIDPNLERRLSDCRELLELWHKFHGYFALALKGGNAITHEREAEFLDLKSRIAMLHDSFMESLRHDQEIGQHILSIIELSITLKHLGRLSLAEFKKMEIEWHESYLLLSETVASMEEQRDALAIVNPTKYKLEKLKINIVLNVKAFVGGIFFKIIMVLIVMPLGVVILNHFIPLKPFLQKYAIGRKILDKGRNVWRNVNPGMPYEKIEEIKRNPRTDTLEPGTSVYTSKNGAASLFTNAGFANELNANNVVFKEEPYKIKSSQDTLFILMFLFRGEEGNDAADRCVQKFQSWLNTLSADRRTKIEQRFLVFRKNNVFISVDSLREAERKSVKEIEFGVREE